MFIYFRVKLEKQVTKSDGMFGQSLQKYRDSFLLFCSFWVV